MKACSDCNSISSVEIEMERALLAQAACADIEKLLRLVRGAQCQPDYNIDYLCERVSMWCTIGLLNIENSGRRVWTIRSLTKNIYQAWRRKYSEAMKAGDYWLAAKVTAGSLRALCHAGRLWYCTQSTGYRIMVPVLRYTST